VSAAAPAQASDHATPPKTDAAAEVSAKPQATDPQPSAADENATPETPKTSGGFVVQLGSFASEANAHKLADQLNHKGYDVAVVHNRDRDGRDWFVVRAGGYASADEAAAAARHMREAEQVPAMVVRLRKPSQA
jgi:cell division septation protein DedD